MRKLRKVDEWRALIDAQASSGLSGTAIDPKHFHCVSSVCCRDPVGKFVRVVR